MHFSFILQSDTGCAASYSLLVSTSGNSALVCFQLKTLPSQNLSILFQRFNVPLTPSWASLVPQMVKNLPAMWETWVQSLGQEYPLEKGMATHSSILGASLLQISLRSSGHQFQCMWEGERQVSHFDKQFSNTSSVQFSCLVMSDSL